MPYGAMLHVLFLGLAIHFLFIAQVPARCKIGFAPVIVVLLILRAWMPPFATTLLQLATGVGILMVYRIFDRQP